MRLSPKIAAAILVLCALLFALARTGFVGYWVRLSQPLGESPRIEFQSSGLSPVEREQFLEGDFAIVTDVKALPAPVVKAFTEQSGSRLLMANPGKRFEPGDVIVDPSVPRKRLIFAGVLNVKCFVHYEQGGIGHSYLIAFFDVPAGSGLKPIWRGYCAKPARNIGDLRAKVTSGACK